MKKIFLFLTVLAFTFNSSVSRANCELLSPEHGDILSTVKSLHAELNRLPESCRKGAAQEAFKGVEQLQGASSRLQEMWSNQSMAAVDPTGFGMSASTALTSIESIGNSIKSVANCGDLDKKQNNVVKLLSGLSDVTMSLAPILMAATIFLPALKGGGMAVAGAAKLASGVSMTKALSAALAVGVGAKFIEVVSEMFDDDILKMTEPNDRDLVLRSICDYQKIKERADFLAPLNSGRIDYKLTAQKIEQNIASIEAKYANSNPELKKVIVRFKSLKQAIQAEGFKIGEARDRLMNLKDDIGHSPDKHYQCAKAVKAINSGSVLSGLKMPMNENGRDLLQTIQHNQRIISENFAAAMREGTRDPKVDFRGSYLNLCVTEISTWQNNMNILLNQLARQTQDISEDGFISLQRDPAFLKWKADFIKWRRESKGKENDLVLLERIDGYMSASIDQRNIIPESELVIEVRGLATKIFGQNWRKKSLAGKWLEQRFTEYDDMVKDFDKMFLQVNSEVNRMVVKDYLKENSKNVGEVQLRRVQNRVVEINRQFNLENLNQQFVSRNSSVGSAQMCSDLSELKTQAQSVGKVLNSAAYLCHFMAKNNIKNVNMDSYIIKSCWGNIGYDNDNSGSLVERRLYDSARPRGINDRAGVVDIKSSLLACPVKRTVRFSGVGSGEIQFIERNTETAIPASSKP